MNSRDLGDDINYSEVHPQKTNSEVHLEKLGDEPDGRPRTLIPWLYIHLKLELHFYMAKNKGNQKGTH